MRNPKIVSIVCTVASVQTLLVSLNAYAGQDESSQQERTAIAAVRAVGGRVSKIAANTEDREVSFGLLGEKIQDEHVQDVSAISNVIWLNLAGTGVTDAVIESLIGMKLQKLYLENTGVGDQGIRSLADMKSLTYLNLYGSKVTDTGLEHLTGLQNLQQLHVWKTEVTKKGVDKLKESLPDLMVTGLPQSFVETTEKKMPKTEGIKSDEDKSAQKKRETSVESNSGSITQEQAQAVEPPLQEAQLEKD